MTPKDKAEKKCTCAAGNPARWHHQHFCAVYEVKDEAPKAPEATEFEAVLDIVIEPLGSAAKLLILATHRQEIEQVVTAARIEELEKLKGEVNGKTFSEATDWRREFMRMLIKLDARLTTLKEGK